MGYGRTSSVMLWSKNISKNKGGQHQSCGKHVPCGPVFHVFMTVYSDVCIAQCSRYVLFKEIMFFKHDSLWKGTQTEIMTSCQNVN